MRHPRTETLLAHLDDELPQVEARRLVSHLGGCPECAAQVARLSAVNRMFGAALHTIDEAEPASWRTGRTRSGGAVEHVIPLKSRPARAEVRWWSDTALLRRAAAILLFTAAAASAAVLGGRALLLDDEASAPLTVTPAPVQPTVATVAVPPENGRVQIALTGAAAGTHITVVLTDAAEATVSVEGVAPHVTAARSMVSVDLNGASAVVRLALPRALRAADVTSDGTDVIRMRNGTVTPAEALTGGVVTGSRPVSDP